MSAARIRHLTRPGIFGLSVVVLALLAPSASGDKTAPLYAKMKQRFTTAKPGHSTGWSFDGALKPYPAGQQVPPQRSVDFVFPRGTRWRLGAVPSCLASDEQIASEGLGACPAASEVGTGEAGLFFGTAGTLTTGVHVFVAEPEIVTVFTGESGAVLRVLRGTVTRDRVTATLPPVQAPGDTNSRSSPSSWSSREPALVSARCCGHPRPAPKASGGSSPTCHATTSRTVCSIRRAPCAADGIPEPSKPPGCRGRMSSLCGASTRLGSWSQRRYRRDDTAKPPLDRIGLSSYSRHDDVVLFRTIADRRSRVQACR